MSRITVVGSLNIDTSYRVKTLPVPGETVLAADRTRAFGGKGGNQAITMGVLGGEVSFIGAVGDDEDGAHYRAHLRDHRVDVTGVAVVPGTQTGNAMVLVDEAGENLIVVDAGANSALDPSWVQRQIVDTAPGVVLAQLEIPVAVLEAVVEVLPPEVTFVLNPAPMPADPAVLAELLERVDVLVPNRKELGQLTGRAEPTTLAQVQECLGALPFDGTVVVTLGRDGALLRDRAGSGIHYPALEIDPVDTTGAGDAFCGALVVRLAQTRSIDEAVQQAIKVAGLSTLNRGAQLTRDPLKTEPTTGNP